MFFFALFFAQSVIGCPFENYEDALIPNGQKYYGIEKKINQKNYQDGFSLGFWMLPVSKMNLFDIPGVLFLLMNDDNMIMAANISSDYQQDQPFILIDVYDIGNNKYSINFNYPFYQYYNQQLFTLIQITGNLKTLRIQMTNQQEIKIDHFQIVELIHTYVFSIGDQYTPPITGRISYPIIFDNFQYSPENFNNFQVECKIPDVFQQGIVKNVFISGIQDFFNNKLLQKNYFEYGRKYCLSGWAKYYTQGLERSRQILLRLSLNSVKSYKWTFGDNLFRLDRHLFDQQQGQSKVKVTLDIFCIIDDKNCFQIHLETHSQTTHLNFKIYKIILYIKDYWNGIFFNMNMVEEDKKILKYYFSSNFSMKLVFIQINYKNSKRILNQ